MDIKVTAFFPKNYAIPRRVPLFAYGNILRFTGKFALNEEPPHDILEVSKFNFQHILIFTV